MGRLAQTRRVRRWNGKEGSRWPGEVRTKRISSEERGDWERNLAGRCKGSDGGEGGSAGEENGRPHGARHGLDEKTTERESRSARWSLFALAAQVADEAEF